MLLARDRASIPFITFKLKYLWADSGDDGNGRSGSASNEINGKRRKRKSTQCAQSQYAWMPSRVKALMKRQNVTCVTRDNGDADDNVLCSNQRERFFPGFDSKLIWHILYVLQYYTHTHGHARSNASQTHCIVQLTECAAFASMRHKMKKSRVKIVSKINWIKDRRCSGERSANIAFYIWFRKGAAPLRSLTFRSPDTDCVCVRICPCEATPDTYLPYRWESSGRKMEYTIVTFMALRSRRVIFCERLKYIVLAISSSFSIASYHLLPANANSAYSKRNLRTWIRSIYDFSLPLNSLAAIWKWALLNALLFIAEMINIYVVSVNGREYPERIAETSAIRRGDQKGARDSFLKIIKFSAIFHYYLARRWALAVVVFSCSVGSVWRMPLRKYLFVFWRARPVFNLFFCSKTCITC